MVIYIHTHIHSVVVMSRHPPLSLQPCDPPVGVTEGAVDEEAGGGRDGRHSHDQAGGDTETDTQKDGKGE